MSNTQDQLYAELESLDHWHTSCDELIDMLEYGTNELDLSSDMATVTAAILNVLSDTISRRTNTVHEVLEFEQNKSMDRFVRRQT